MGLYIPVSIPTPGRGPFHCSRFPVRLNRKASCGPFLPQLALLPYSRVIAWAPADMRLPVTKLTNLIAFNDLHDIGKDDGVGPIGRA